MPKPTLMESMTPEEREEYDSSIKTVRNLTIPAALVGLVGGGVAGRQAQKALMRRAHGSGNAGLASAADTVTGAFPFLGAVGGGLGMGELARNTVATEPLHKARSLMNTVGRRRNEEWRNRNKEASYTYGTLLARKSLGLL